ncbi:hypothetical protein SAY87_000976 [Trapa incisa]|uniref:Uncharacterized protein n=1 Tax=Trapa incisa TaxID=236973 RepID=A0AAN7JHB6_9MYRT|nr:hypothetical protein SAY87_000976 [Trapa incisa]
MVHSLTPASASVAPSISAGPNRKPHLPSSRVSVRTSAEDRRRCPCIVSDDEPLVAVHRRIVGLGLAGVVLGLVIDGGPQHAVAAARRPPPPPPEDKRDPNVSGVQAKVLASKKRKEAMKQAVAKMREKGKTATEEIRASEPVAAPEPVPASAPATGSEPVPAPPPEPE